MKKLFCVITLFTVAAFATTALAQFGTTPPLHVEGNQLKDDHGNTVVLHGVMDTPSPYFNNYRWGNSCESSTTTACINYFNKLFTAMTDTKQGAWCNVFRLHLDPCWTNDPSKARVGGGGEENISQFSETRLKTFLRTLYFKIAKKALDHGLYVIMRPPGVFPQTVQVGDEYNQYLMTVWDIVTQNDSIKKYAGQISIELGNEPVNVKNAQGQDDNNALHDFFQPIIDKMRANGFTGIIWAPGTGWQSNYRDYATHPLQDYNLGYAVHNYVGWYGADDNVNVNNKSYYWGKFEESVPVLKTHPIVITEVDWSPEKEGTGHYNEHGNWVNSNYGTWATGHTSKWGVVYKSILDHFGNISMTLTGTSDFLDIDVYLKTGKVVPAFKDAMEKNGLDPMEACGAACFKWYEDYAKVNLPDNTYTDDDYTAASLASVEESMTLVPNTTKRLRIIMTSKTGITRDVTTSCEYTVDNTDIASVDTKTGKLSTAEPGNAVVTATHTDRFGNTVSTNFTVSVEDFPITNAGFNARIMGSGTFNEKTGAITPTKNGFSGWYFAKGYDLSKYKYLVVKLKRGSTSNPSFRIFDADNIYSVPFIAKMGTKKSISIDLQDMTKDNGKACKTSKIYYMGFHSEGTSPIYLSEVFLSDDGENPTAILSLQQDSNVQVAEMTKEEYYTADGRRIEAPQRGITIVKRTFSNGTTHTFKMLTR